MSNHMHFHIFKIWLQFLKYLKKIQRCFITSILYVTSCLNEHLNQNNPFQPEIRRSQMYLTWSIFIYSSKVKILGGVRAVDSQSVYQLPWVRAGNSCHGSFEEVIFKRKLLKSSFSKLSALMRKVIVPLNCEEINHGKGFK